MSKRPNNRVRTTILLLALAALSALFFLTRTPAPPKFLQQTHDQLKKEGFKTDLTEFDFTTPPELRARVAVLTNCFSIFPAKPEDYRRRESFQQFAIPMVMIGSNSAILSRKQEPPPLNPSRIFTLQPQLGGEFWPQLRKFIHSERALLHAASAAALYGPIRFHLDASKGHALLLPHLTALKDFSRLFGVAALLELHDGNKDSAWTNVLAATRLITAWEPEPTEISILVRFACARLAFNTIWQALPAGWSDDRLAALQKEWETAEFFRDLPEAVAYARASAVASCQAYRNEPFSLGLPISQLIRNPGAAWSALSEYRRETAYRNYGIYEDERDLLLHFRDRELELRRAAQAPNWAQMKNLPGVTNFIAFQFRHASPLQFLLDKNRIALSAQMYAFQHAGTGSLLGRAAEAETLRRILLTAIALERYRSRHYDYPPTLHALVPDFISALPIDFMDGQPLRYQLLSKEYLLYSVGLDCIDNGGVAQFPAKNISSPIPRPGPSPDLVWPRIASQEEIAKFQHEQMTTLKAQFERRLEADAFWHFRQTAERQSHFEEHLRAKPAPAPPALKYEGRPLAELLQNPTPETNYPLSLDQLLTLKQITTTIEPEIITFELPLNYDSLTSIGTLELLVDPVATVSAVSDTGSAAIVSQCTRSTNGNALITWNTIYEAPGQHALQVVFLPHDYDSIQGFPPDSDPFIFGPCLPVTVTNLCQFTPSSAWFNPALGANLRAKFSEPSATCSVDFLSLDGSLLKTIHSTTTDGILTLDWDLTTNDGLRWTNDFKTLFHITLPASGKSQVLRGP